MVATNRPTDDDILVGNDEDDENDRLAPWAIFNLDYFEVSFFLLCLNYLLTGTDATS